MRSGLRNRSKISLCLIGSRSVIPRTYATSEPAADPRPGPHADADGLGVLDEVGHHEEVAREAHLDDDAELVLGLLAVLVGDAVREPLVQPPLDLLDQPRLLGLALGDGRAGHEVLPLGEPDVHPLGDQQRVVAGLGELRVPLRAHLRRGLEVEVLRVELEPVRVGQGLARLHAQQHLVRLRVVRVGVVQVVRGQPRQAQLLLEPEEVFLHLLLDADAVVHQLAEEVVAAEDVAVVGRGLAGVGVAVLLQQPLDLAGRAAGGGDDPRAVGLEQLAVHAGLVVVALEAREAGEPEEVVHPLGVLGQQRHVGVHLTRVVVTRWLAPFFGQGWRACARAGCPARGSPPCR